MSQIEGQRIIITGGASGMGEAAARRFVREGAHVAVLDVQDDRGAAIVAAANAEGPGRAVYQRCDVRSRDGVQTAFASAVEDLGGLDAHLQCAGVDRIKPAAEMTEDEWDFVVDINLKGTFLTNQAAFPHLRENGGRVINFASSAGLIMFPGHGHYVASKAGVIAWSRSLAREWGEHGITVNSFLPFAETPMIDELREALGEDGAAGFDEHAAAVPLGRIGDPETDIVPVLLFLLSDASRYITGQIMAVDGGNVPVR
ncbi:MAG: SDR family oxidoreductase [Patulibacter sp.]|nr:SDR family oxidoreductase [Patulibacter sp.]